jgi:hypothetical protein
MIIIIVTAVETSNLTTLPSSSSLKWLVKLPHYTVSWRRRPQSSPLWILQTLHTYIKPISRPSQLNPSQRPDHRIHNVAASFCNCFVHCRGFAVNLDALWCLFAAVWFEQREFWVRQPSWNLPALPMGVLTTTEQPPEIPMGTEAEVSTRIHLINITTTSLLSR